MLTQSALAAILRQFGQPMTGAVQQVKFVRQTIHNIVVR